jgi:hypothetical protein
MVSKRIKKNVTVLKSQVLKAHSRGFHTKDICKIINTLNGPFDQITYSVSFDTLLKCDQKQLW